MREIKFRAWNIVTNTMIDLKAITPLVFEIDTDGLFIPFSDGLPLMQYTGLKDHEGVEIYEGDIMEMVVHDERFSLVCFWGADASFSLRRISNGSLYAVRFSGSAVKSKKVIGNIYENPELLEGGK